MSQETHPPLVYEPDRGSYVVNRPISGSVSVELVQAVAELSNTDPVDMEPIYHRFDPDALDDLYEDFLSDRTESSGTVVVGVADHWASIESDGTIRIYPPDDADREP